MHCTLLDFSLSNSQAFAKILEWAAYKYNVEDYNTEAEKLKEKSEQETASVV